MMKTKVDPIMMLKKLIPRQEKTMIFPLIKLEETKKLIQKLPNTTSHGMDPMTNRTLKKMESRITPLLTHLINSIIKKEKFPQVMKITRIVPILKKGKDVRDIDSYRPINNLMCLEKIIEEYFKRKMEEFIKENEILNPNHHGGRKHHSTITAKSAIEIEALKANEEGRTVAIYSTDLSAAYDTIDHRILRSKLEHYGFRGSSGRIIKSYLNNRRQYVEVQSKESEIIDCLDASVIQGSKLSGLLYNLYSNEVPLVHKLLENPEEVDLPKELKMKDKEIFHEVHNFVDDSSSAISSKNEGKLLEYIKKYTKLMKIYYSANILKINQSKTVMMIVPKNKSETNWKKVEIKVEDGEIKTSDSMKMLGGYINEALNNETEINRLTASLANIEICLRRFGHISDMKTRLQMANAVFRGRLNYFIATYSNITTLQTSKLAKRLHSVARWVVGGNLMGISNHTILTKCGWLPINLQIKLAGMKILHSVVHTGEPKCLANYIKKPRRMTANIALANYPRKSKLQKFMVNRCLNDYNNLNRELKIKTPEKFNEAISNMFRKRYKANPNVVL